MAKALGDISDQLPKDMLIQLLKNTYKTLVGDDSEHIKDISIDSLVQAAKCLTDEEVKTELIPLIIQLSTDKSWRVRSHLAIKFSDLATSCRKEISNNQLLQIFTSLIRD